MVEVIVFDVIVIFEDDFNKILLNRYCKIMRRIVKEMFDWYNIVFKFMV